MSRIGKRILNIPQSVSLSLNQKKIFVKGPLGELNYLTIPNLINVTINEKNVVVTRENNNKNIKQLHGTINSLINSMIIGVSQGFKKELLIKGVGYKAALKGKQIEILAGYSHPCVLNIIEGVKIELPKPTIIIVSGINKQVVGQMAAIIRDVRRPSPYSGKGIMYKDEQIRRKEGKATSK